MKNKFLFALWASTFLLSAQAEVVQLKAELRADDNLYAGGENLEKAVKILNQQYQDEGKDTTVELEVSYAKSKNFDDLALSSMRSLGVGKGADIMLLAHEWVGSYAESDLIVSWDEHIKKYKQYDDVIPSLWKSTTYKGHVYGIPTIPEVRMFYYNKDMLREIGKDEEFINSLPEKVKAGEFTIDDFTQLAKEVKEGTDVEIPFVHRPNAGPDFYMLLAGFGQDQFQDATTGKLVVDMNVLKDAFSWFKRASDMGVLLESNTSMSWDAVHSSFINETSFIKFHGIWGVSNMIKGGLTEDNPESYFHKVGWTDMPAYKKGGKSKNLTHPLAWVVAKQSKHAEIAQDLISVSMRPDIYTQWAEARGYLPVYQSQKDLPSFQEKWISMAGIDLLDNAISIPLHPKVGTLTEVLYKAIQGIETQRIDVDEALEFVADELEFELGDQIIIKNKS